ncbi:unnamed protein product [Allacma fusca]|uniref:Uncharacterized protein n=1 Tax=Allacma fusca TaxID=39272 RepID=A0A8J2NKM8_9HEXA|nr:unnamed protein product [Allacma fusca]
MDTVFDEEEIKLELGAVEEFVTPGSSTTYDRMVDEDEDEDEDDGDDDPFAVEDSDGGMDMDELSLDTEREAYESSKDDSETDLEGEILGMDTTSDVPWTVRHPISQTGFGSKVPKKLKDALELLKGELNLYKQQKPYTDAIKCASDPHKIEEALSSWKASCPETCEKLEEQLTAEFLAYTFIKFMLRRQYDDDDDGTERPYRPTTEEEWGFVSDFLCSVSKGENEIYKFFDRLKNHESFTQYLPYIESLSLGQVSTLIWDSSIRAQRIILKLSNLHESALSTLDKIIKLNRDSTATTKIECEYLEARIKLEAERAIQNYGTSELTTNGRRNLLRGLSAPYIKSENGIAGPSWNPYELPFTFQQLSQANFSQMELEAFQVAVLKTVIETRTAQIEDRCSQLLTKAVNNSTKPQQRAFEKSTLAVSGLDA